MSKSNTKNHYFNIKTHQIKRASYTKLNKTRDLILLLFFSFLNVRISFDRYLNQLLCDIQYDKIMSLFVWETKTQLLMRRRLQI